MRVGDKEVVLKLVEVSSGGGQGGAGQEEGLYGALMSPVSSPAQWQGTHPLLIPWYPMT